MIKKQFVNDEEMKKYDKRMNKRRFEKLTTPHKTVALLAFEREKERKADQTATPENLDDGKNKKLGAAL